VANLYDYDAQYDRAKELERQAAELGGCVACVDWFFNEHEDDCGCEYDCHEGESR